MKHQFNPSPRKKPDQGDKSKRQPPQNMFNWGFILRFLIIWAVALYAFRTCSEPQAADLTYSTFKEQVKQEKITSVTVQGEEIRGQFKQEYLQVDSAGNDTTAYQSFVTILPSFDDPQLLDLLEKHQVTIDAEASGNTWLNILLATLPWLLLIGLFIFMSRAARGRMNRMSGGIFGFGKSRAKRYHKSDKQSTTYEDVAGLENAKRDLQEITEYLKNPRKFAELGAEIPKGTLLVGPPGTGKTLLARATAGEAGVPFFSISGSEFIEMFVGVGASRVRDLFKNAKKEAPALIFIDEIDSIGRARGTGLGGGHDEREQTLNQILSEMDGFEPHESVVVLAATNRPDVLDSALTRPGRFDRHIQLELPRKQARRKILEIHSREVPLAEDVDLEGLAARTVGFSGADLKNLVNEAALLAGRKNNTEVTMNNFDTARDRIILGSERDEMIGEEDQKIIAFHEAGHALLAAVLPHADPLQKVTVIPRGRALGVTEQIPETDRYNPGRKYLLDRMTIMLGGRAAEKLIFQDITVGAADDLKQVTQMARSMVCRWGMSERLGSVTYNQEEEHPFLGRKIAQARDFSEHTAKMIDEEVREIIQGLEEKAAGVLEEHRQELEKLAETLLDRETLNGDEVEKILRGESRDDTSSRETVEECETEV